MSDTRAVPAVGALSARQRPTVGRMVHYVSWGSPVRADGTQAYVQQCRAAVVTEVGAWVDQEVTEDGPGLRTVRQRFDRFALGLHVMNPTGVFDNLACQHGDGEDATAPTDMCGGLAYRGGTWHHPCLP